MDNDLFCCFFPPLYGFLLLIAWKSVGVAFFRLVVVPCTLVGVLTFSTCSEEGLPADGEELLHLPRVAPPSSPTFFFSCPPLPFNVEISHFGFEEVKV